MQTTAEDIFKIVDGSPIEIAEPCPLPGMTGKKWFMRQPDDWVYDMAQAVFDAKRAQAMAQPEIADVKALPPSEGWIARQNAAKTNSQERLAELAKEMETRPLTVEEDLERRNLVTHLMLLIDPNEYTRADELAHDVARDQRDWYLLQKLVVDERGTRLFDLTTEPGKRNWESLGRDYREKKLRGYCTKVLVLVQSSKNSEAGQNLN